MGGFHDLCHEVVHHRVSLDLFKNIESRPELPKFLLELLKAGISRGKTLRSRPVLGTGRSFWGQNSRLGLNPGRDRGRNRIYPIFICTLMFPGRVSSLGRAEIGSPRILRGSGSRDLPTPAGTFGQGIPCPADIPPRTPPELPAPEGAGVRYVAGRTPASAVSVLPKGGLEPAFAT